MSETTHALIIAIEQYHNSVDFPDVQYANKDAKDFKQALLEIGVLKENITTLKSKATKGAIITSLRKISRIANKNDNIYFYYSGHGVFENSENYLTGVDAIKGSIPDTSITIAEVLGYFKDSACCKTLLFLDCCHSGFVAGKKARDINLKFSADDLKYKYKDEKYCYGFASCSEDEKSYPSIEFQNGIWTHFLIQALNGDAKGIYDGGVLFNDKLQTYLNQNTKEYTKRHTTHKENQTPISFGSFTDRFIVADLTKVFEKKAAEKAGKTPLKIDKVNMQYCFTGSIKRLRGFKNNHHVPTQVDDYTRKFVRDNCELDITEVINDLASKLRSNLKYKRSVLKPSMDRGSAMINTPDFDLIVTIEQNEDDPSEYKQTIAIENFSNSDIILNEAFNNVFDMFFDTIEFQLDKVLDLENLIDDIETLENPDITLDYEDFDISYVIIVIKGLGVEIEVTRESLFITQGHRSSPLKLYQTFQRITKELQSNRIYKLLK